LLRNRQKLASKSLKKLLEIEKIILLEITKQLHQNRQRTSTKVPKELSPKSLRTCTTVAEENNEAVPVARETRN